VTTYKTGESFSELPGERHAGGANASGTKPAKLLAVFVVNTSETELTIPFGNPRCSYPTLSLNHVAGRLIRDGALGRPRKT